MATLLVADDLVPIRQMVRITLSTQGWTILEAKNGSEALEMAKAHKPDLILLDVDMGPGPNGFEVCKTIKADASTKDIPVVMLTAHESDSDRAIGFAAGATQYLTKPFGPLELIDTIRGILGANANLGAQAPGGARARPRQGANRKRRARAPGVAGHQPLRAGGDVEGPAHRRAPPARPPLCRGDRDAPRATRRARRGVW